MCFCSFTVCLCATATAVCLLAVATADIYNAFIQFSYFRQTNNLLLAGTIKKRTQMLLKNIFTFGALQMTALIILGTKVE